MAFRFTVGPSHRDPPIRSVWFGWKPTQHLWLLRHCRRHRLESNGKVYVSNGGSMDRSDASETALASKTEAWCRICSSRYRFRCE